MSTGCNRRLLHQVTETSLSEDFCSFLSFPPPLMIHILSFCFSLTFSLSFFFLKVHLYVTYFHERSVLPHTSPSVVNTEASMRCYCFQPADVQLHQSIWTTITLWGSESRLVMTSSLSSWCFRILESAATIIWMLLQRFESTLDLLALVSLTYPSTPAGPCGGTITLFKLKNILCFKHAYFRGMLRLQMCVCVMCEECEGCSHALVLPCLVSEFPSGSQLEHSLL